MSKQKDLLPWVKQLAPVLVRELEKRTGREFCAFQEGPYKQSTNPHAGLFLNEPDFFRLDVTTKCSPRFDFRFGYHISQIPLSDEPGPSKFSAGFWLWNKAISESYFSARVRQEAAVIAKKLLDYFFEEDSQKTLFVHVDCQHGQDYRVATSFLHNEGRFTDALRDYGDFNRKSTGKSDKPGTHVGSKLIVKLGKEAGLACNVSKGVRGPIDFLDTFTSFFEAVDPIYNLLLDNKEVTRLPNFHSDFYSRINI